MARTPRIHVPGFPQHVMLRGNNRAHLFHEDADRFMFLRYLEPALKAHGAALHAYVLMSNHVHMVMTGSAEQSISAVMQSLGRRFCRYFNAKHGRTGTVFEGRFKSSLIETDRYFFTCMRYAELNPVRAGMVDRPMHYPWSSHSSNAAGDPCGMLTPHGLYIALGLRSDGRGKAYQGLFEQEIPASDLNAIRAAINCNRALGGPDFLERLKGSLGRPVAPTPRARKGIGSAAGTLLEHRQNP